MKFYSASLLMFLLCASAYGSMGEPKVAPPPSSPSAAIGDPDLDSPLTTAGNDNKRYASSLLSRYSVLFGGELWRMGSADQFFPALALRYRTQESWLPMIELGGTIPTTFDTTFHQVSENFGPGDSLRVNIASGGEAHLAGAWPFFRNEYVIPQLSAGLSVASLKNALIGECGYTRYVVNTTVSPFAELGTDIPFNRIFSGYIGLGYRYYSNTVTDSGNDNFKLFVSAVTLRAMFEVRL